MLYLAVFCAAVSVITLVLFLGTVAFGEPGEIVRRLEEFRDEGKESAGIRQRRRRQRQAERVEGLLIALGARLGEARPDLPKVRRLLLNAGYHNPNAVSFYWGTRITLALGLGLLGVTLGPLRNQGILISGVIAVWLLAFGWLAPVFVLRSRARARQHEIERALPDALDLLVVCVEAGLGLNHAMVRVSEEIDTVSSVLAQQLALVNFEIRAGTPREDALRHLAERTGVTDVASLVTMLIQTDRFGTSVGTALRVHADTIRTKRRQRAEEAGAKTTVKLVFPLVLFVFPAMFVVILGPAILLLVGMLGQF
jgi:tight adherence protein C